MRKKSISLLLALIMLFSCVATPAFSAESAGSQAAPTNTEETVNLSTGIMDGPVTISADGTYSLSSVTSLHGVTVKTGVTATLIITDVALATTDASPILVESGASLTLQISGDNTLTAPVYYAGIAVLATDTISDYGTLTITGDGKLTAICAGNHGAGIGGSAKSTTKVPTNNTSGIVGKIIIESGTIVAKNDGGTLGAGIGSGNNCTTGAGIEINGGHITAIGGKNAAGIGGIARNPNPPIVINGGYIKATGMTQAGAAANGIGAGPTCPTANFVTTEINGGSIAASFRDGDTPTNKDGETVRQIVLTMLDQEGNAMANKAVSINNWQSATDAEGKLYLYVPEDTTKVSVKCDGKSYVASGINSETTEYTLTEETGSCTCNELNAWISLDLPDSILVNVNEGKTRTKLAVVMNPAADCTYSVHDLSVSYSLSMNDAELDSSIAVIDGEYLEAYYAGGGNTIQVNASASLDGIPYSATKTVSIIKDDTARFNLSNGNIEITADSSDSGKLVVKSGSSTYSVSAQSTVHIYQTSAQTDYVIKVWGTDARIAIEDLNIRTQSYKPLTLGTANGVDVTLELIGDNTFYAQNTATIEAYSDSTLTIEGSGTLTSTSGVGAGIGSVKTLTINSGTVTATGGNGGAGIGGGNDGGGIEVIVNGGCVYAYGNGNAAGIGGGAGSSAGIGGNVTINGGLVVAQSEIGGSGIGPGGKPSVPGTVTVSGGSIKAAIPSAARPKNTDGDSLYLLTLSLEEFAGQADVSYVVGDDDTKKIATRTVEGKLYLYVEEGLQRIRVYKGEDTYYAYVTINKDDTNTLTAVLDPEAKLEKFNIVGQIGDTVFGVDDEGNPTVSLTVPHNIMLDQVAPITDYKAAFVKDSKTTMDFSNGNTAVYTLVGHDTVEKPYTVTLTLAAEPSPPQADVYDISKGDIKILGTEVRYGGTYYKTNNLGYKIIGSTKQYTLSTDYTDAAGTAVPPITLQGVSITLSSAAVPMSFPVSANVTVEGICNIKSSTKQAIEVIDFYGYPNGVSLTIGGTGHLNIQGAGEKGAIAIDSNTSVTITQATTSILNETGGNALSGNGTFITDSETYMRIDATDSPQVQPENSEGTPLYQLTARIDAVVKSDTPCEYNEKTYYVGEVGEDATFYLMVPNDTYIMDVVYDDELYLGEAVVNNAPIECSLKRVVVDVVNYSSSDPLPAEGTTVNFTVTGKNVAGTVIIRLKPNDKNLPTLQAKTVGVNGSNEIAIASVTIPENASSEKSIVYTVYYVIRDTESEPYDATLYQLKNVGKSSACYIRVFKLPGQVSSEIADSGTIGIITVNMPYDHVYQPHYQPTELIFEGEGGIYPLVTDRAPYSPDSSGNHIKTRYTVTAGDGTTRVYEVQIYKETTPQITRLSFTNPTTADGETVRVTVAGTVLENIAKAENSDNIERKICIYSDDGTISAYAKLEGNTYVAELNVPSNTSETSVSYTLKAKIGDVEQPATAVLTVPGQKKAIATIKTFTLDNQVGATEFEGDIIKITMPYDADLTYLLPEIELDDMGAFYTPITSQDFSSDVVYTVTAENRVDTKDYTVKVTKQNKPVVTGIEFENPQSSGAGRVAVTINGTDLDNVAHSINLDTIVVSAELTSGESGNHRIVPVIAAKNADGDYVAELVVNSNNTATVREYTITVTIGDDSWTFDGDGDILKVPAQTAGTKELTDFVLAAGQSALSWGSNNTISIVVPYNTDLTNIEPTVHHTGASYSPTGPQDFTSPVPYTITAKDSTTNTYTITAIRGGVAKIDNLVIDHQPTNFDDVNLSIDIEGNFVLDKDEIKLWVVSAADGTKVTDGTVTYGSVNGKATAAITLPINQTTSEVTYVVKVSINDREQDLGFKGYITVPGRSTRRITSFTVNGQIGTAVITEDDVNGNTISFAMPYATDLTSLTPVIIIDGDDYTPKGPQNFESPVSYTVSAAGDIDRIYTVTAQRDGVPSISSVTISDMPQTFVGGTVNLAIEGVFFTKPTVRAVPVGGGAAIDGTVQKTENHRATASILLPLNDNTEAKDYTLEIILDGGVSGIVNPSENTLTVPRRTTRAITNFTVNNQIGIATITETDIYVEVPYDTDLSQITPALSIDGDSYSPTGVVDFNNDTNSVPFTVSAADDEDRTYTVHISRSGRPAISKLTVSGEPSNFKGGEVLVRMEGSFFESAEVSAVPVGGGNEITGVVTFEEGKASAILSLPPNEDTEKEKVYQLKFVIDGFITSYSDGVEITIPRRTSREMKDFMLPGIQEGDTRTEGTNIYVNVPYHLDITNVVPSFTYDADSITPAAGAAVDFSDLDNPVRYTLSSSGDEDVTYVIFVTRIGEDPRLLSLVVDGQQEDTVYDGDNIHIILEDTADLTAIEPILTYEGTDYSPKGPQDFSGSVETPVQYTLVNKYGVERTYNVSIEKKQKPAPVEPQGGRANPTLLVSFNTKGALPISPVRVTSGSTVAEPTEPEREGYTFDGWYIDSSYSQRYDFSSVVTKSITLYAKWIQIDVPDESNSPFTDVSESDWYYNAVLYVAEHGLFNGTTKDTFAPNNKVTRGMLVTVLYRAEGEPEITGTTAFRDIDTGAYYAEAVVWGQQNGIIKGYSETEFVPEDFITREQIAAIMHRYAEYKGYDVSVGENTNILSYEDFDSISEYAIAPMQYAAGSGLMKGKAESTLNPKDNATRAEIAAILHRFTEVNS